MRARAAAARRALGVARATAPNAGADVRRRAQRAGRGRHARDVRDAGRAGSRSTSPLVGDYNLENLAIAVGMAVALGLPARRDRARRRAAVAACPGGWSGSPTTRGVLCVVDYAHTPDALERAIAAMRAAGRAGG